MQTSFGKLEKSSNTFWASVLCVEWKKSQARVKCPPKTVHKVLNDEMDGLTKLVHSDNI